jgi:putative spermidine/putrescine transport system permease protein
MLGPALLLTGVLVVALLLMADASLHELDRATFMPRADISLGNYAALWSRPVYLWIALRTLFGAVIVTAVTLALALPYAWLMVRTGSPGLRKLLLLSLFLPFFLGQVVRAYGWLIVLGKQGLLNSLLGSLGLPPIDVIYTFGGVLLGLVQYMLPFAVLLLAPAMTAIPEEVELASASLGAVPWRTWTGVIMPLARPGLVASGIVVFTLSLTDFAMPEIMGGGSNDFIANAIYDGFFQLGDSGLGAAMGIVLTAAGSLIAAALFTAVGLGTLAYVQRSRT